MTEADLQLRTSQRTYSAVMDEYRVFLFSGQNIPNSELYDAKWYTKDYSQYFQDPLLHEQYEAVQSDFSEARAAYDSAFEESTLAKAEFVQAYESTQSVSRPNDASEPSSTSDLDAALEQNSVPTSNKTPSRVFQKVRNVLNGKGFSNDEAVQEKMYEEALVQVETQAVDEEDSATVDTLVDLPVVEVENDDFVSANETLFEEHFDFDGNADYDEEFPVITLAEGIPAVAQYQIGPGSPFSVPDETPDGTYEVLSKDLQNPTMASDSAVLI